MKGRLLKLLKNPLEYVEEERFPDNSWLISLCGYFLYQQLLPLMLIPMNSPMKHGLLSLQQPGVSH